VPPHPTVYGPSKSEGVGRDKIWLTMLTDKLSIKKIWSQSPEVLRASLTEIIV